MRSERSGRRRIVTQVVSIADICVGSAGPSRRRRDNGRGVALFEMLGSAEGDKFRQMLQIVK